MYTFACILLLFCTTHNSAAESFGVHLPLRRRGGRFAQHALANTTALSLTLQNSEARYSKTFTDADGNRIVRRWQDGLNSPDDYLLDEAGLQNTWYTVFEVGEPHQWLEVDIDMLSPDFYTIMTTSGEGSKYDTFASSTHESSNTYSYPLCRTSHESFHLPSSPGTKSSVRLDFPVCQAGKYSQHTLARSGTILGLSPRSSKSLSRLSSRTLVGQLLDQQQISLNLFSMTVLTPTTGILSLGGTIAPQIEEAKIRTEAQLKYLGRLHINEEKAAMEAEIAGAMAFAIPPGSTSEHHFKWTDVGNGAVAGWHMTLVTGVWVNGVKILRNQPVLFDINCPFILAPPSAAQTLYRSIPGAQNLVDILGDQSSRKVRRQARPFSAFPCLNPPDISLEIAGWRFPIAKGEKLSEDILHGPAGGRFSLGRVDGGSDWNGTVNGARSGYCVGVIVETTMGSRRQWSRSGMRDVWVLGEPFFRGLGVTFDLGDEKGRGSRIGVRIY